MSERENYAEPGPAPAWERRAVRRRVYTSGIIALSILAAVLAFVVFCVRVRDGPTPTGDSIYRARLLVEACKSYRQHHPDHIYPATLADLAQQLPSGPGPFIDDRDLTDGWGNPFRYALVPNGEGELEPYVWAERTRNGKTTLHGAKLAADGTVVVFGRPGE